MVNTKNEIQRLYTGVCDLYEYHPIKNPVTKITSHQEVKVNVNPVPCRKSTKTISAVVEGSGASMPKQVVQIFMDPSVVVKPGSKIVVTQNGDTTAYKNSGKPAVYSNHQQIVVELFEKWT